jgi:hypothetical protein
MPDKRGGLNRSMQHHLLSIRSVKVVFYEARKTVRAFRDGEE